MLLTTIDTNLIIVWFAQLVYDCVLVVLVETVRQRRTERQQ